MHQVVKSLRGYVAFVAAGCVAQHEVCPVAYRRVVGDVRRTADAQSDFAVTVDDVADQSYWSVVENTRVASGGVVQRHVLYLGEINDSQELAWRRSIEVLEAGAARPRTLSLFAEDRVEGLLADASIVGVRLSELRLRRPRQWGACWLALMLWRELQLDQFWSKRLGVSRKGTRWDQVLFVLVAYRLLAPGSEWRLHREWFQRSALADLLGEDAGLVEITSCIAVMTGCSCTSRRSSIT